MYNRHYIVDKARECINDITGDYINEQYYGKKQKKVKPWCCMFVWYIFRLCGYSKLFYNGKKTASCTTLMKYCKKHYSCDTNLSKCKAGDLVFFQFDDDANSEHIGIFECTIDDKNFITIEGNTKIATKNGVFEKARNIKKVLCFAHLPYDN